MMGRMVVNHSALCPRTLKRERWLQARRVLTRIRGTADVDTELDDISQASAIAAQVYSQPLQHSQATEIRCT